jgi:ribosome-binding protein aMBF1 (putative translation factor)
MTRRTWQEIKTERLASMTPAQRATFDAAYEESSLAAQVGEQIRDARENAGISQRELARRIGSTQAVISRIEAGSVGATLTSLQKIASSLEVDLEVSFRFRNAS